MPLQLRETGPIDHEGETHRLIAATKEGILPRQVQ